MKKLFSILAFTLLLLISYLIIDNYVLKNKINSNKEKTLTPLPCDLNSKDCVYKFKNKEILISLTPKPIKSLQNIHLKIKNLGTYENLKLKIYGLNMFMGEINPKIYRINQTDYEAQFTLSACSMHIMRFRAELINNNKPIDFYFDFDLRR
ncbi:hypothetical protein [Campylobacter estrildidarum]|uniref:Periplasmic protein n=1 Tax=Campylobacter estrildidarum TaxID=2510189 RepID=A0A4U7BLE4_9BACT|nr:hypothetical protein [Campylobacter estrildidarum]TKX30980.1 hypothetical protein CQA69_04600 [Campylobacter estrildidarum]